MKATLPTNYQDDILNVSTEGKRKYRMNYNDDGTVSFVDVTPYDQEGSDYGAGDINATNQAVNESFDKNKLIRDMDAINALTQEGYAPDALALKDVNRSLGGLQFGIDENGNYGYYKYDETVGADTLVPFKSGGLLVFTNYGYGADSNVKQGNTFYDTDYIASVNTSVASVRTITFKKDCNISLFQSLHCGTTWTEVVVTLNNTEIIHQRLTTKTVWYDMLNLSIKSGDIITVQYTYSNVVYVGGETVITFS